MAGTVAAAVWFATYYRPKTEGVDKANPMAAPGGLMPPLTKPHSVSIAVRGLGIVTYPSYVSWQALTYLFRSLMLFPNRRCQASNSGNESASPAECLVSIVNIVMTY